MKGFMNLILNYGFAWISVILAILLTIIYVLRKLGKIKKSGNRLPKSLNKSLRAHHKLLGLTLIITGLIHGVYSSERIFSINLGTICWLLSILLGINYLFRKVLKNKKGWMYYHRILSVCFIAALLFHVIDAGIQAPSLLLHALSRSDNSINHNTLGNNDTTNNNNTSNSNKRMQMQGLELKDGIYDGEATGYGEGLRVNVKVKDNAIINIDIVAHNERNPKTYSPAMEQIPDEIIKSQSLSVDTVSGATFTSIGIINAVKNALSKALVKGTLPQDLELPQRGRH